MDTVLSAAPSAAGAAAVGLLEGDETLAAVEAFLVDHRSRRATAAETAVNYGRILRRLARWTDIDELTPAAFYELADRRGWGMATRASYWTAVRAYSSYRLRAGLAAADPFAEVRSPRFPAPNPKPVSPAQRELIARVAARRAAARPSSKPVDEWVTLAAYAGLRCCEIARVRGEHLRETGDGWVLDVPHGKGGSCASIPAHPDVVKVVSRKDRGLLYPGETAVTVQKAGIRVFNEAGVPGGLHRLRHSYATAIYQATGDPFRTQRLCRHRSLNATLAYAAVADRGLHETMAGLYG